MPNYDYLQNPARYQYSPRTLAEAFKGAEYACAIHSYDKPKSYWAEVAFVFMMVAIISYVIFGSIYLS